MESVQAKRKDKRKDNQKKGISKVLKYISNTLMMVTCAILIFIIITSCITIFDAATHPGKTPSVFGYKVMTVITGSMKPQINPGDLVIATNIKDLNSVKVGTVVSYLNKENVLITHRVIEINNNKGLRTYITKGDANPAADVEPVSQSQIQGTYKAKIPYLGYVGMFVKTGIGMISLIVIPLIIIFGLELINYFKKPKTKKIKSIEGHTL